MADTGWKWRGFLWLLQSVKQQVAGTAYRGEGVSDAADMEIAKPMD